MWQKNDSNHDSVTFVGTDPDKCHTVVIWLVFFQWKVKLWRGNDHFRSHYNHNICQNNCNMMFLTLERLWERTVCLLYVSTWSYFQRKWNLLHDVWLKQQQQQLWVQRADSCDSRSVVASECDLKLLCKWCAGQLESTSSCSLLRGVLLLCQFRRISVWRSNATSLTDVRCAPLFVGGGKTETDCFENTSDQAPTSPPRGRTNVYFTTVRQRFDTNQNNRYSGHVIQPDSEI